MARIGRPLAMPAEDRKKEIYAAAEQLFGERGYEKVTMAQIAAQAGMSKKTLYVHFQDKEDLLKALISSSCIWSESAFGTGPLDPVEALKTRLKVIADHVLSARHLKLCRLAIGESAGITGLAEPFYQMGIEVSRQSLIAAVAAIEPARRNAKVEDEVMADMLFGATVSRPLLDALLIGKRPDMKTIHDVIEQVIAVHLSS